MIFRVGRRPQSRGLSTTLVQGPEVGCLLGCTPPQPRRLSSEPLRPLPSPILPCSPCSCLQWPWETKTSPGRPRGPPFPGLSPRHRARPRSSVSLPGDARSRLRQRQAAVSGPASAPTHVSLCAHLASVRPTCAGQSPEGPALGLGLCCHLKFSAIFQQGVQQCRLPTSVRLGSSWRGAAKWATHRAARAERDWKGGGVQTDRQTGREIYFKGLT